MEYILTFPSTNHAIKAEQYLLAGKLHIRVLPLPSQIQAGCGICLRVPPEEIRSALDTLSSCNIEEYSIHTQLSETRPFTYYPLKDRSIIMKPNFKLLMDNCTSGGCGAKMSPGELSQILTGLPVMDDLNLMVGFDSSDDAGVYRINDKQSLITTADFFPPMVNDPKIFGRIAAANALSDIYAMGGKPLTALNLVCFPQSMESELLRDILLGGAEKVLEASAVVAGGHSIYDKEPKYGLAVTGIIDTDKIIRNNTPAPGHKLILTKPLGTGIIMAAHRGNLASTEAIKKATDSMTRLNRYAAEKITGFDISAGTDITGFGLLAHALEMASNRVSIHLYADQIPYFTEAYEYANEYLLSAAGQRNRNYLDGKADVTGLPFALQELMFDPQTSGGLLLCVAPQQSADLLAAIQTDDPAAKIIGEIIIRKQQAILF